MTTRGSRLLARIQAHRPEAGFTLIELLIAVVLSSMIAGVTVAALMTSLNVASSTTDEVSDSTDAGLISAFLYRDAQSAGATDPTTAQLDPALGVSTNDTAAGWANCTQPATLVVRFSWVDRTSTSAQSTAVSTYALDANKQLIRRLCKNGTNVDVIVGRSVNAARATCMPDPACGNHPRSVALDVTGSSAAAPFTYTLTAALRANQQGAPTADNSSVVSLIALGDAKASAPCPNLTLTGNGVITVTGDVLVDSSCGPTPIQGNPKLLHPTGTLALVNGVGDPFLARQPPQYRCEGGNQKSTVIGDSPNPKTVVVYSQPITISSAVVFKSGRYVFCAGLSIVDGAIVTGKDILFYIAAGSLTVDANASVDLTAFTAGQDAHLLIWNASPQRSTLNSAANINHYRGMIYAPNASVQVVSENETDLGGVVARTITFTGPGSASVGLALQN